jgi:hypothetical protein
MKGQIITLDGPAERIPAFSEVCTICRHLRPMREGRTCDAFPVRDSIPMVIWLGENDHQTPFPGDHGVQFEPVDTEYARQRFAKETPAR